MDRMLAEPYFTYAPAKLPNLQDEFRQIPVYTNTAQMDMEGKIHEWRDGAWHEVAF
jgi:hypothetical protein